MIHYQFDHNPELVNSEHQTELYTIQYLETMDLYRKEFGMEPQENIWGTPKFDKNRIDEKKPNSKKKNNDHNGYVGDYSSDSPLYTHYDEGNLNNEFTGFDGGDGGGGGASGDWGDSNDGNGSGSCSSCSGGCGGGGD